MTKRTSEFTVLLREGRMIQFRAHRASVGLFWVSWKWFGETVARYRKREIIGWRIVVA